MKECCKNCKHYLVLRKSDYTKGGCINSAVEGYVCTAFGDEGIAYWTIGLDENESLCECFRAKAASAQLQ